MGPRGCGNQYFFSPKAQLWEAHSRCFMRWDAWHPSTMGGGTWEVLCINTGVEWSRAHSGPAGNSTRSTGITLRASLR